METGFGLIDKVIARWSHGDWTPVSLFRTGMFWSLFWLVIISPATRIVATRWANHHRRKFLVLSAFGVLGFVAACLAPLTETEWSLVDDHEILMELKDHSRFTLTDFVEKITSHVELGGCLDREKNLARFRPVYYFLRYLEVWLWQGNPHAWGRARIFLAVLALWLVYLAICRVLDPLVAGIVVISIASFPSWHDTWSYLGRAEIYAAVGTALSLYGFSITWPTRKFSWAVSSGCSCRWGWGCMVLGLLIGMGSKENFSILLGPIALTYVYTLFFRRSVGFSGHLAAIAALGLLVCLIAVLKFKLSLGTETDIYGNSTGTQQRLSLIVPGLRAFFLSSRGLGLLAGAAACVVLGTLRSTASRWTTAIGLLGETGTALGISCLVFVSQYVFYFGELGLRYRFPAEFCDYLAAVWLAHRMSSSSRLRQFNLLRWRKTASRCLTLVAAAPCLALGPHQLHHEIQVRVERTIRFEKYMSQLVPVARRNPERPIVVETSLVFVYEPSYAMPITLRYLGVSNPLYHRYSPKPDLVSEESPYMYRRLKRELTEISREGRFGYRPWPQDDESRLGNPIVVGLDSEEPVTKGEWMGRAPW